MREKYSTEVVLQGYNGTLTMLDGARGAAGGMAESGQVEYGGRRGLWFVRRLRQRAEAGERWLEERRRKVFRQGARR